MIMTSQPLQFLLVLMLMFTLCQCNASKAAESRQNGNDQQQEQQQQPHQRRVASEKSQEYVEKRIATTITTTTTHNRRHPHHHNEQQQQQHRHHRNESATNYHQHQHQHQHHHQQRGIIENMNNMQVQAATIRPKTTTTTKTITNNDFEFKSKRKQHEQKHPRWNKRQQQQQQQQQQRHHHYQHMTAHMTMATTTTTTTTTAPEREDALHLTLNAANEDNDRIGHKRSSSKHKHHQPHRNVDHAEDNQDDDDDDDDDVVVANDENYYDDFDYTPQDYVANDEDSVDAVAVHDDVDDDARWQLNAKILKSRNSNNNNYNNNNNNVNYNRAKAFAARRVPRDQRYVGSGKWNAINADNSNEEDYPADEPADHSQPGQLTLQKLAELGTPLQAQAAFNEFELRRLAKLHQDRVIKEASCSVPKPQVVYINQQTSERFFPRGTILHRCNESTGCCLLPFKVCGPKTTQNVTMPFEVQRAPGTHKQPVLIQLVNHTECKCEHPSVFASDAQRRKRSHEAIYQINTPRPIELRRRTSCQCPKHFERIITNTAIDYDSDDYDYDNDAASSTTTSTSSECICDCHSENLVCQRLKNGEEAFAVFDRKCISRNNCAVPTCSHGVYNPQVGRCPHVVVQAAATTSKTATACSHNRNHHGCHRNYG